jgi:hypothetical protein
MLEVLKQTLLIYALAIVVSLTIAAVIKAIVIGLNALERKPGTTGAQAQVPAAAIDVDADHIAAIAAAVYATIRTDRIVHIEAMQRGSEWLVGGRIAHHGSHARTKPTR